MLFKMLINNKTVVLFSLRIIECLSVFFDFGALLIFFLTIFGDGISCYL
jgi:hypothetical protein